jgi:hypothetical protein
VSKADSLSTPNQVDGLSAIDNMIAQTFDFVNEVRNRKNTLITKGNPVVVSGFFFCNQNEILCAA